MTEAHFAHIIEQNAKLLEQNQQLIAMLSAKNEPVAVPRAKASSKKDRQGGFVTAWFGGLQKQIDPALAAILKAKLLKRGLWQG